MHFVTGMFIALICFITAVLFKEVFPKWFKAILALIGGFTSGYALAILIRKIAIETKAYAEPELWMTTGICTAVVIGMIVIITIIKNKRIKK